MPGVIGHVCSENLRVCLIPSRTYVSKLPQVEIELETRAKGSKMMMMRDEAIERWERCSSRAGNVQKESSNVSGGKVTTMGMGIIQKR
jgi:hypothetical protein